MRPLFDKVALIEVPPQVALERPASQDSHRYPEACQAFKSSVTIAFGVPNFVKYGAASGPLVLL